MTSGTLKGWHVLVIMLGFFGTTIAVNGAMAFYAISTFAGEDIERPYQRGLEFNKTLTERKREGMLGWSAVIGATRIASGGVNVTVRLADRQGTPQDTLKVSIKLRRPTDANLDRALELQPSGGGEYTGTAGKLEPGAWDVIATATTGSSTTFEAQRRIVLK